MRRRLRNVVLALLCVLSGALAALPASLLAPPLSGFSDGRWQLGGAEGTLWHGQGQALFVAEDGSVLPLSPVAWSLVPAALLRGELTWRLRTASGDGALRIGYRGWQLENVSVDVPVAAVAGLSDVWRSARLGGLLRLHTTRLAHDGNGFDGKITLDWMGAASPLTRVQPFGRYQFAATGQGTGLALVLETLSGPLRINGQGQWQPGRRPDFGGSASSDAEHYAALRPLLLMLGQPSGAHSVSWRARSGI